MDALHRVLRNKCPKHCNFITLYIEAQVPPSLLVALPASLPCLEEPAPLCACGWELRFRCCQHCRAFASAVCCSPDSKLERPMFQLIEDDYYSGGNPEPRAIGYTQNISDISASAMHWTGFISA